MKNLFIMIQVLYVFLGNIIFLLLKAGIWPFWKIAIKMMKVIRIWEVVIKYRKIWSIGVRKVSVFWLEVLSSVWRILKFIVLMFK